jgi:hypothetical protein
MTRIRACQRSRPFPRRSVSGSIWSLFHAGQDGFSTGRQPMLIIGWDRSVACGESVTVSETSVQLGGTASYAKSERESQHAADRSSVDQWGTSLSGSQACWNWLTVRVLLVSSFHFNQLYMLSHSFQSGPSSGTGTQVESKKNQLSRWRFAPAHWRSKFRSRHNGGKDELTIRYGRHTDPRVSSADWHGV